MAGNMKTKDNTRKMIEAIMDNRIEEAEKLLNDDVDFNIEIRGDNPIHVAARTGKLSLIKKMKSKQANLQQKNVNGNTPMHYAAREGYMEIVRYLKENKADINPLNKDGESPLHLAVIRQPMDIIEKLIDKGMDPNIRNKETGQTPLHTALSFGRIEAMEGLLIKGAKPDIKDKKNQRPADVAKTSTIRETLRTYGPLLTAMKSGCIQAEGFRISAEALKKPLTFRRVNIRLEEIILPQKFSPNFYCRREKSENSTVPLPVNDEEHVFSDVFHVRISDVNNDCPVKIYLPLYAPPPEKEEMVIRFVDHGDEDRPVSTATKLDGVYYCLLETKLIPETTCACVIFVRPKKEVNEVPVTGMQIQSKLVENFSMDVPGGAFEENTTISLKVYDAGSAQSDNIEEVTSEQEQNSQTLQNSQTDLLSNVFQINVSGVQPKKSIRMQIPLSGGFRKTAEDIAIVTGDEAEMKEDNALQLVSTKPDIVNGMVVFEVSHFCIYVPVPKDRVGSATSLKAVQREISITMDRKKAAAFFVVAKQIHVNDFKHLIIVECLSASKSKDRRSHWEGKAFEPQNPDESEEILTVPGDTFTVSISGNAQFEEETDENRKLTFSPCRASFQGFTVILNNNVDQEKDALIDVIINKQQSDGGNKEVTRLKVQLHPPILDLPSPESQGRMNVPRTSLAELYSDEDRSQSSLSLAAVVPCSKEKEPSKETKGKLDKLVNLYKPNYSDEDRSQSSLSLAAVVPRSKEKEPSKETKGKLDKLVNLYKPKLGRRK